MPTATYSVYPEVGLVWLADFDPNTLTGVAAPLYQFLIRTDNNALWYKFGPANTQWDPIAGGGGGGGLLSAIAAGTQTASTGTVDFSNANGVTFGMAGSSQITASVAAQSVAPGAISAGSQLATSGTVDFSNANGVTFGMAGSSVITASVAAQSVAPGAISAGSQLATSGTVDFSNANGVTFGMAGSSVITASVAAAGPNVAAGTQTAGTGTVDFANSNGISFGMSGSSQVTASYGFTNPDFQNFSYQRGLANLTSLTAITERPFFVPFYLPYNVKADRLTWQMSQAVAASSISFSASIGIYTIVNSTSMALLDSNSNSYSASNTGSISGIRQFLIDGFTNAGSLLTRGEYVLGFHFHTIGGTASINYILQGQSTGSIQGYIGSGADAETTATNVISSMGQAFFGNYSVTSASLPANVGRSDLFLEGSATQAPIPMWFRIGRTS